MSTNTENYNMVKPADNETADIAVINANMDTIDAVLKPTADPAQVPSGLVGKLNEWISWITNRIKAITGKTNWYDAPDTTLAAAKTHIDATAPHSGHETPAGAQAKADAVQTNLNTHLADFTLQVPYGGTTTNVGNAYSIATPAISALSAGMAITVKCNADSTAAVTLNWDAKGAKSVLKANGTAVTNWKNGGIYTLRYDGTNFILQGEGASGNATASDLRSGKTATTDAGEITGALVLPWGKSSQSYTTAGTYSFTVPDGVFKLTVIMVGGGGGGGGSHSSNFWVGGGGGSGATVVSVLNVNPGDIISITVGAAGTAGANGSPGQKGGDGGATIVSGITAGGGIGGNGGGSSSAGTGGAGGTASGTPLDLTAAESGTNGTGNNSSSINGKGGDSIFSLSGGSFGCGGNGSAYAAQASQPGERGKVLLLW